MMTSDEKQTRELEGSSPLEDGVDHSRFYFPRWANYLFPALLIAAIGVATYIPLVGTLAISPETRAVGYEPKQPIPFSHAVHAGKLKIDCRYCHSTVETAAFAAVPAAQTCLNCHASIKSDSKMLEPLTESFKNGKPIHWIKVHDVPDFVFFNHSAHINKGVGCESCHGRIDQMEEVSQAKSLSMAWCLECHRAPEVNLRPRDKVTVMGWNPSAESGRSPADMGAHLAAQYHVQSTRFLTSCSTCHR